MKTYRYVLAVAVCVGLATHAQADPCDSPQAIDYRLQPGGWVYSLGGKVIDMGFVRAGYQVVALGSDEDGFWLRTYEIEPPTTVSLLDERRELLAATALEVQGSFVYILAQGKLVIMELAGAGLLLDQGSIQLEGNPTLLAVRGDRAWAGGGQKVSVLDLSDPVDPQPIRSVEATVQGGGILRARGDEAWLIHDQDGVEYFKNGQDALTATYMGTHSQADIVDLGWANNGDMIVALGVSDGYGLGRAGAALRCEGSDTFLRGSYSTEGCGGSVPYFGGMPIPDRLSEDPVGLIQTGSGGGDLVTIAPAWGIHGDTPTYGNVQPSETGPLLSVAYESAWMGSTFVGRTRTGLLIQPPDDPSPPDPVLAVMEHSGPLSWPSSLAQNGSVIAFGCRDIGGECPGGIVIVDASDPSNPYTASYIVGTDLEWAHFVEGDPRLFARFENEVRAWDVSTPALPIFLGARTVPPGSARVASHGGRTALFVVATDSTELRIWSPPGDPFEEREVRTLSEPFEFFKIVGSVVGGSESFVLLDSPDPLSPQPIWKAGVAIPVPLGWGTPAHEYSAETVVTGRGFGLYSLPLRWTPAREIQYNYERRPQDASFEWEASIHAGVLWHVQFEGVVVAQADGVHAGSLWGFVHPPYDGLPAFGGAPIVARDEFVVALRTSSLVLLAPHCSSDSNGVPTVVRAFSVTSGKEGCAVIQFETADRTDLDLLRVSSSARVRVRTEAMPSGAHRAVDCPGGRVRYELVDSAGVVYASQEYSPAPSADRRSALISVRPNPFNPSTLIEFSVADPGVIVLAVFDSRGRHVRTLYRDWVDAGRIVESWDGTDDVGSPVAAGVYFVSLRTSTNHDVAKVALVK